MMQGLFYARLYELFFRSVSVEGHAGNMVYLLMSHMLDILDMCRTQKEV